MICVADPDNGPGVVFAQLQSVTLGDADEGVCRELLGSTKRLRGWIDAFEAQVTTRLRVLHDTAGGAPAADLHSRCGGVSAAEGKRKDRRAETIEAAPLFGDARAGGVIGAEHVDALANATAHLDDDTTTALLGRQDELVADAGRMTPERFGRACRDRARALERDQGLARDQQQRRDTYLSRKLNGSTGMIEGRFALHPELANQIFTAVDRKVAAMITAGERRDNPEFMTRHVDRNRLAAEALGTLVAGGHQQQRPLEADITIIVDADTATTGQHHQRSICETGDGAPLPPASVQRLICQGRVVPVVVDQHGVPFDMGRTIRHANRRQRALRAMYRCCAFDDCDVVFDRCEIHHIRPWELGGPTNLANLIPSAPATTTTSTTTNGNSNSPTTAPSPSPNPTATSTHEHNPTSHTEEPQRDARRHPTTQHPKPAIRAVSGR